MPIFFSFKGKTEGVVNAESQYRGSFSDAEQSIKIESKGKIIRGGIGKFSLAKESTFAVRMNLLLGKEIHVIQAKLEDSFGLSLKFNGKSDWQNRAIALSFDLTSADVDRYYSLQGLMDSVTGLSLKGGLSVKESVFHAQADVYAKNIESHRLKGSDVRGNVEFINDKLIVSNMTANFYDGNVSGEITLDKFKSAPALSGAIVLEKIDLKPVSKIWLPTPLLGKLSAFMDLSGSLRDPRIDFQSEIDDLSMHQVRIKDSKLMEIYLKINYR